MNYDYAIVIPYGVEKSGTVVFATRLAQQLTRWGFKTVVASISKSKQGNRDAVGFEHFTFASDETLFEWVATPDRCRSIFWGGFFEDEASRIRQILLAADMRTRSVAKSYFLWERTGYEVAVPEDDLLRYLVLRGCDGIAVLNKRQEEEVLKLGIPRAMMSKFSTGIDTVEEFCPSSELRCEYRIRYGWPRDQAVGLCVARFVRRKRIDFLIEHWPRWNRSLSEAPGPLLAVVGSGFGSPDSIEDQLREQVGERHEIQLIKYSKEMDHLNYYRAADFFVTASEAEGEPMALLEAMSFGLPVFASSIDGHLQLVESNQNGLFFDLDAPDSFRVGLDQLTKFEDYRRLMGLQAREFVAHQRDIRVVAARFLRMAETELTPTLI